MRNNDVKLFNLFGFLAGVAAGDMRVAVEARLGRDRVGAIETASVRLAKKTVQAMVAGDQKRAGKLMGLKLVMDASRAMHSRHENPMLARQIMAGALSQCASFYDKGDCQWEKQSFVDPMSNLAKAMNGEGAPDFSPLPRLSDILTSQDAPFAALAAVLMEAASHVEVTIRAGAGDASWRSCVIEEPSVSNGMRISRAAWSVYAAGLMAESQGETAAQGILKELQRMRSLTGGAWSFSELKKKANQLAKDGAFQYEDGGRSERFLQGLNEALLVIKSQLETEALGSGAGRSSLERSELEKEAAKGLPSDMRAALAERREAKSSTLGAGPDRANRL